MDGTSRIHRRDARRVTFVSAFLACIVLGLPATAGAQAPPGPNEGMNLYDQGCMQDVAGFNLNCTANDVAIAGVAKDEFGEFELEILDDGCAYPGDEVDFEATFELVSNSKERHDIGIYFVEDGDANGDGALTGQCSISTIPYKPDPPWLDLDGTTDPLPGTNITSNLQDLCGDVTKNRNPMRPTIRLTATCVDSDKDGKLNLPYCLSWRQAGSNEYCDSPLDAYPGSPSKCKCDNTFNVPIDVPPAELQVVKKVSTTGNTGSWMDSVDINEPGATVYFQVSVTNTGIDPDNAVTLNTLLDDIHGDLTVADGTTCVTGGTIEAGATYTCTFQADVSGNADDSETDTVTAYATDQRTPPNPLEGSDSATVRLLDVTPSIDVTKTASPDHVTEPGDVVTFTILIVNDSDASSDALTIGSLSDNIHGDIGTCASLVGYVIPAGGSVSCSFTAFVGGNAGYSETDTFTVNATDDEGNPVSDSGSETVTVDDAANVLGITVTKTANPDEFDEPSGTVTFSISVVNNSTVDVVTLHTLEDTIYGDLNGQGDCSVPQSLAAGGGSYSCSFVTTVELNGNKSETDIVTASGVDDDGFPVSDKDDATVTANNVAPSATVDKVAESALVKFKVTVTNTSSAESLTLDSLVDDRFGDVTDTNNVETTTCATGQTLAISGQPGDSYVCYFEAYVTESPHTDTVTATVSDDDGSNPATPSDSAQVSFEEN